MFSTCFSHCAVAGCIFLVAQPHTPFSALPPSFTLLPSLFSTQLLPIVFNFISWGFAAAAAAAIVVVVVFGHYVP